MLGRDLARGSTEGFTEAAFSSSPEGIRTPDLFLEREAPWTTRRPGRTLYTRIRSASAPDRDDRRHQDLNEQVVGLFRIHRPHGFFSKEICAAVIVAMNPSHASAPS